jgi:hypothetical protein
MEARCTNTLQAIAIENYAHINLSLDMHGRVACIPTPKSQCIKIIALDLVSGK